jgi:hypothetical protein
MSRNRFDMIGLDRLVRFEWLEKTSNLILAGNEAKEVRAILREDLKNLFRSDRTDVRGSLDKTITILMKVWLTVPPEREELRLDGLELLKNVPVSSRLVIHWGMVMSVYPFWAGVAAQVGRLLRLQDCAAAYQVQRRVREQYGERETVSRRTRYVLRSYLDWGVLQEAKTNGVYAAGPTLAVDDVPLISWLVEAFLHTREDGSFPMKDLLNSPILFPFQIEPKPAENYVADSSRLEILRHGLDDDLIMLRKAMTKRREPRR